MAKKLSGVFAPITTPFVDEEVSFQYLKENMKLTPARWMGITAFLFIIACMIVNYVIIIMNLKINLEYLYKIDLIAFGVFTVVWGAVFGSGAIKKIKEVNNDKKLR